MNAFYYIDSYGYNFPNADQYLSTDYTSIALAVNGNGDVIYRKKKINS